MSNRATAFQKMFPDQRHMLWIIHTRDIQTGTFGAFFNCIPDKKLRGFIQILHGLRSDEDEELGETQLDAFGAYTLQSL